MMTVIALIIHKDLLEICQEVVSANFPDQLAASVIHTTYTSLPCYRSKDFWNIVEFDLGAVVGENEKGFNV